MYLICNHKNKLTYNEVKEYKKNLDKLNINNLNLIMAPSLPFIYDFIKYDLAAQDISIYDDITGEISGKQLKSLCVDYVLVGHIERRKKYNEDIDVLKSKIEKAHENNLKVIYIFTSIKENLDSSLDDIEKEYLLVKDYLNENDLIAFEPEWTIGNKKNLDYNLISKVISYLSEIFKKEIIYGGSVNENTIDELLKIDNINGFLVSTIAVNTIKLEQIIKKMI